MGWAKNVQLPRSFSSDGFESIHKPRTRRRLLICSDGLSDTGKTEFILSAPGPGILLCLDRGQDKVVDNPRPPEWRSPDWGMRVVQVPMATTQDQNGYMQYWRDYYDAYKKACNNQDAVSIGIDGDSDSWELQRLAAFGKLTQIPSIFYTEVNAARRAYYARAHDANKIAIFTSKVKKEYVEKIDPATGQVKMGTDGKPEREWKGDYERQGFQDADYYFPICISHYHKESTINKVTGKIMPAKFGLKITKCGFNSELVGAELEGDSCNFRGLVNLVFPEVDDASWGFKD